MKYLQYITLIATILLLHSCGEDRSGEFYALIEDRIWIEETMRENYLWYEEMPIIENEYDYFQEPETFFKNLLYKQALDGKGDNYSYITINNPKEEETRSLTLNRASTYGFEFELTNDPTGTTAHIFARILYVLPQSPAEKAGIQRGDWISAIDGERITNSNYTLLQQGGEVSLARNYLSTKDNTLTWQSLDTLNVGPSVTMEINPFLVDTLYETNGQRIAYLVYNEFSTGPKNDGSESVYDEQMKNIFSRFKAQSPDAFILDLRYNNGGYLQSAQALGSLLAPASDMGKDFINLTKNNKTIPQTVAYPFDPKYADANLNMSKVYILISDYTASASEAVINGLIPYLGAENVVLIGQRTEGKNVAMSAFENITYGFTLWPVVAYVSNANGESDYINGFEPTYQLIERNVFSQWYPLGDTREYLLKNTLSLITTGIVPDATNPDTGKTSVAYSSLSAKGLQGIRIR